MRNKVRSVKNYLIKPKEQLSHTLFVFSTVVLCIGSLSVAILFKIDSLFGAASLDLSVIVLKDKLIDFIVITAVVGTILLSVILSILNIVHTHRVFGALYSIEKHLKNLLSSGTTTELHSRENDQTGQLPELVNELKKRLGKT